LAAAKPWATDTVWPLGRLDTGGRARLIAHCFRLAAYSWGSP